ncbi:unnamed protein product [Coffea canephora]|uniref:DH200=94 genomic scaffold, scaffold_1116 n=1 Tax=Coffea canephora TaxID=49390 RepID=A0A068VIE5_COFCA|nr:unnamed protein product [Coffea canephora]
MSELEFSILHQHLISLLSELAHCLSAFSVTSHEDNGQSRGFRIIALVFWFKISDIAEVAEEDVHAMKLHKTWYLVEYLPTWSSLSRMF